MIVGDVNLRRHSPLLEVIQAKRGIRFFLRPAEHGQQERGENPDDGYHHQQLDQRKSTCLSHISKNIQLQTGQPLTRAPWFATTFELEAEMRMRAKAELRSPFFCASHPLLIAWLRLANLAALFSRPGLQPWNVPK